MTMLLALLALLALPAVAVAQLPIVDAHIHYSHDAWEVVPPKEAVAILRRAGVKRALVSSSDDEGTQKLVAEAPDIVVPELRPYRTRGDASTWTRDPAIIPYLEERLRRHTYVAIGEFHLFGADAELPVPRRLVELARQHGLMLHAHADADAVERLFRQYPEARILWAHAGFESPARVGEMLRKHRRLWADLAFRSDHGSGGKVPDAWRALFTEFPDRFMVGTDTFVPERWLYVPEHAAWSRAWLADLPADLAERIAWKNGEALFGAAPACRPPGGFAPQGRAERDGLVVLYRTRPAEVSVGRHFTVEAVVCAAAPARLLRVDADMPEHRHGMNYRPRLSAAPGGHWVVEGLLFHMPGRWRLLFDVERDGRTERLAADVLLE